MVLGSVEVLQSIANGLVQGGFLALASAGLSLIFGVQKILNLAHSAFIVLAAFLTIQFSILVSPVFKINPLFSIPLDVLAMAVVGLAAYYVIIRRVENAGFETPLLATFGLAVMMQYLIQNGLGPLPSIDPSQGIGAEAQNQTYSASSFQVGPVFLNQAEVFALVAALFIIPCLQLLLSRTYFGLALRATSHDWEAAEFSGIDTRSVRRASFVIGSATTGVAGGLLAFTTPVTPSTGTVLLLPLILEVIIIGGVGSMTGTLAAGFLVGLVMNVSTLVGLSLPGQFANKSEIGSLVTFLVFLIVLIARPSGLFGGRTDT